LCVFQLSRNILATQPRVTRFKIEWDDKPAEAGTSGATSVGMEDNSMENADSNSSPPILVEPPNMGNGNGNLDYGRCMDNNGLMDPTAGGMLPSGIATCTSNNSMSAPMEVI